MIVVEKIDRPEKKIFYSFVKRIFDIICSLVGIIVLFIPCLVIALMIKRDSKGPVFYKQERLGLDGKPFMLIKFRSMRVDAEKDGAVWASDDDDRCTKVGSVIRKYRIDEIPQLWNILKGDMSIVGPRPERKIFYDEFREYIDGFDQRLYVVPGLTGLAQVNGGYDLKPEEKILFDIEYMKKRSFMLDLKIMFKTVGIVFSHEGAR